MGSGHVLGPDFVSVGGDAGPSLSHASAEASLIREHLTLEAAPMSPELICQGSIVLLHITRDSSIHKAGETLISVEDGQTRKCFAGLGRPRAPHHKKAGFPARPPPGR